MLNVLVPQIVLKRPRVLTIIGELEAAGMSQHVRMDRKWHSGALAKPAHHATKPDGANGRAAFAHEHVAPRLLLPLQSAERPKLAAGQRMHLLV